MADKKTQLRSFSSLQEAGDLRRRTRTSENGAKVYRGVTLIKAGLGNHRDKNYYPAPVLREAAEKGTFEGIKAYADHQTSVDEEIQPERTVRDIVGIYSDTRFVEDAKGTGGRIVGDLRVLRSQKWLSDTIDELIEMGQADKIGLSINGRGQTAPQKVKLEESGEEIEANVLQRFIDVRSTDVVTEAGAGGGFQQLLESARGAAKETGMTVQQMVVALREAADAGDLVKVKTITTKLEECGCEDLAEAKKKKKGGKAEDAKDGGADDDMEEADADPVDEDAELDEAVDAAKSDADLDDEDSIDEDDTEGADVEESDDEEPTDRKSAMKRAAETLRAHTKEAAIKGIAKGKSNFTKRAGKDPTKARRFGEADVPLTDPRAEIARLRNRLSKTELRNERLAEALRVRQSADIARKLLKESGIPSELRADLVDRLIRLPNEEAMQKEIRFQQRLLETVSARAREEFEDSYSEVEGAGSRVRESWGGGDDELVGLMRESGLPMRTKK